MGVPANLKKIVNEFKARSGIDATPEHLAMTIHLMYEHKLDKDSAMDQSARAGNDHGIDGWYLSPALDTLTIYQSKFTDDKGQAIKGLGDLDRGMKFIETIICDEKRPKGNLEHSVTNLLTILARYKDKIKNIQFVLVSLADEDEVRASDEFDSLINKYSKSKLNKLLIERNGGIDLEVIRHNFKKGVPRIQKTYPVKTFDDTLINLRKGVTLRIAYLSLASLVRLYRERGTILFDKNVRLSLLPYQDSLNRVAHPMEETLTNICNEKLPPEIFPYYHIGVTIWAATEEKREGEEIKLDSPSIVNGCQTVTIANRFLTKLEDQKDLQAIERFENIHVMAKIVIGADEDELREITNSNNRQNPIDNWQLYSNDRIHIEIETELEDLGIFYERQKGKFKSLSNELDIIATFDNTHDTYITIPELAQVIALCKNDLKKAAKYSEIFTNKKSHENIFGKWVIRDANKIVVCFNLLKASKRAFKKIIKEHKQDDARYDYLDKPISRVHFWQLGIAYGVQRLCEDDFAVYHKRLYKIASPTLVNELEEFFASFLKKSMLFYNRETEKGEIELTQKKRNDFFTDLAVKKRLRIKDLPFN